MYIYIYVYIYTYIYICMYTDIVIYVCVCGIPFRPLCEKGDPAVADPSHEPCT